MKKVLSICAVVAMMLSLGGTAGASLGTVDIQKHGNGYSDQGTVTGGNLNGVNGYTGVYSWTNNGGTGLGTDVPNWGFCIELTQGAANGVADVIELGDAPIPPLYGTPMGTTKANYVRELWGRYFDSAWTTGADKLKAEAFNAAIWEIVYETAGWDVTTGPGFFASGIEEWASANTWLGSLNGDTAYFAQNLVAVSNLNGQDFLVQVPEPATMALLGLGALVLRRKKA